MDSGHFLLRPGVGVRHPEGEGGGGGQREAARVQAGRDAVGGRGRGVHHVQAAPSPARRSTGQGRRDSEQLLLVNYRVIHLP